MSLSDKQWTFLQDVAALIGYAKERGFKLTGGDLFRPPEFQEAYYLSGRSKTKHSRHSNRLAIDFNIFLWGKYLSSRKDREDAKPLGEFWEGIRPENRWGGSWRGKIERGESDFIDIPHFETMR